MPGYLSEFHRSATKPSEYEFPGSSEDFVSLETPQKFSILSIPGKPGILMSGLSLEFFLLLSSFLYGGGGSRGIWVGDVLADSC